MAPASSLTLGIRNASDISPVEHPLWAACTDQGRRVVVCRPGSPPCDYLGWHLPQRRARSGLACSLRVTPQLNSFNSVLPAAWSTCFWTGRTEHLLPLLASCGRPSHRYPYHQDSRSLRATLPRHTSRLRARLSLRALRRSRHQASGG